MTSRTRSHTELYRKRDHLRKEKETDLSSGIASGMSSYSCLKGLIIDAKSGRSIQDAKLSAVINNVVQACFSSKVGEYEVNIQAEGVLKFSITKNGYKSLAIYALVRRGQITFYDILLESEEA